MECAVCQEREASVRYYRLNRLTEQVDYLCRPCWLAVRRADGDEWSYFKGVSRFVFLYSVLPTLLLGLLLGALVVWLL